MTQTPRERMHILYMAAALNIGRADRVEADPVPAHIQQAKIIAAQEKRARRRAKAQTKPKPKEQQMKSACAWCNGLGIASFGLCPHCVAA